MLNKEKLEKLLLANWTQFLDTKSLFSLISHNVKIQKITLSRFELTDEGFIIWAEYNIGDKDYTSEILLAYNGNVLSFKTI